LEEESLTLLEDLLVVIDDVVQDHAVPVIAVKP
jgi:hypothetical protein